MWKCQTAKVNMAFTTFVLDVGKLLKQKVSQITTKNTGKWILGEKNAKNY